MNQGNQQPELIFYGKLSGVVGLSKNALHQTVCDSEILSLGYDKVKTALLFFISLLIHHFSL